MGRGLSVFRASAYLCAALLAAFPADAATFGEALLGGRPHADIYLRYNTVEQSNKALRTEITNIRARLGYTTAPYRGVTGLVEFDLVQHIGAERFDDTTNHRTQYPQILDPDLYFLNRFQLDWGTRLSGRAGAETDTHLIAGRQYIAHGDMRYISNTPWRQHFQTFDALTFTNASLPATVLTYSYVRGVNRPTGPHNPLGYLDGASHLFNAVYGGLPHLRLEGFAYLLDFQPAPLLSSATYGASATGNFDLGAGFVATALVTVAHQTPYGRNPRQFGLGNYRFEGRLGYNGLSTVLGHEILEGNGTSAFQTPLTAGRAFQGWAEVFTNKPPQGVTDSYAKAIYTLRREGLVTAIVPQIAFHDFSAQNTGADYGSEWDAGVEAVLAPSWTLGLAFADFKGAGAFPDRRELWTYVNFRY
jgi:hypothetical protein